MLPNCVLLGGEKSGSTFLQDCLREHPEAFMPPHETRFFEDPTYDENKLYILERKLEGGKGKRILAIKRPAYLARPECPARIARHCPDAKLIVILRNPIERCISAYHHFINHGYLPPVAIESGLPLILNGEMEENYPRSKEIIEFGYYHKHLTRYLQYFDPNQLHISFFDDLKLSSLKVLQSMYSFLGISAEYVPKALNSKPEAVMYSLPRLKFRSLRHTYRKKLPRLPGDIFNKVVLSLDYLFVKSFSNNQKPVLGDELRRALLTTYRNDIEKLETLVARDLSSWKR